MIIALSACNLPGGQQTDADPAAELALTITAQALLLQPGATPQGQQPQQPPPAEPQATATLEFTPTLVPTFTPSVPQVTVSTATNCRTGPGQVYDLLDALLVGQTREVVGKNSGVPNYWVIKRLNGSGTCWLWGQYATVTGNTSNLPEYPVPPTPTPKATNTPTATPVPSFAVTSITYSLGTWSDAGHTNCPRVTANITTNGAGTVNFKWTRQDTPGGGSTQTLDFAAAGTQSINYDWARGSVWAETATWVGIFVVSPNNQDFGKIDFSTACTVP